MEQLHVGPIRHQESVMVAEQLRLRLNFRKSFYKFRTINPLPIHLLDEYPNCKRAGGNRSHCLILLRSGDVKSNIFRGGKVLMYGPDDMDRASEVAQYILGYFRLRGSYPVIKGQIKFVLGYGTTWLNGINFGTIATNAGVVVAPNFNESISIINHDNDDNRKCSLQLFRSGKISIKARNIQVAHDLMDNIASLNGIIP